MTHDLRVVIILFRQSKENRVYFRRFCLCSGMTAKLSRKLPLKKIKNPIDVRKIWCIIQNHRTPIETVGNKTRRESQMMMMCCCSMCMCMDEENRVTETGKQGGLL